MTWVKCNPNLETPAQNHTVKIRIFSAMIMSTNGNAVKENSAGKYCSPRAARKMVLSRRPMSTNSTIGATSNAGFTRPDVLDGTAADSEALATPGNTRATTTLTISAAYSATSNQVRRLPAVNGTHPRPQPDGVRPRPESIAPRHRLRLSGQRSP